MSETKVALPALRRPMTENETSLLLSVATCQTAKANRCDVALEDLKFDARKELSGILATKAKLTLTQRLPEASEKERSDTVVALQYLGLAVVSVKEDWIALTPDGIIHALHLTRKDWQQAARQVADAWRPGRRLADPVSPALASSPTASKPAAVNKPRPAKAAANDGQRIVSIAPNPKKPGSATHTRYAGYAEGMTRSEAQAAGLTSADIAYDTAKGFIVWGD